MEPGRRGSICRHFINGSCRFGPRCNYRHELPVLPSAQICRNFQKGGCWYGENCRFLHVLQPEVAAASEGRRSSVPDVFSTHVAHAHPDRRGSEPAVLPSTQECSMSELHIANSQHNNARRLVLDVAEEQSQDSDSSITASSELVQNLDATQEACNEQTSSAETAEEGAAAAASGAQVGEEKMKVFLQSKDVTCGICMDKVYEKTDHRQQVFGILPNCSHAFCLQCIMTWRKTKDFGPDVVKSCPQCRVRSAFYVPSKDWVEGQAKESIIAAFTEKCSKKNCGYYARYRCCPFKTECLYRHKPSRRRSFPYPADDEAELSGRELVNFFLAMALLRVEDDDENDFALFFTEEWGF